MNPLRSTSMDELPITPELLTDLRSIDVGTDAGAFVIASAASAQAFLELQPWGRSYSKMLFGAGVLGVVASFLVRLSTPMGAAKDEFVWVTSGAMPNAYLVTDRASTPIEALGVYGELVRAWIDNVVQDGDPSVVFPFACSRDLTAASQMNDHLDSLECIVRLEIDARAQSLVWIDGLTCHGTSGGRGQHDSRSEEVGMRGCLVVDNAGGIGIAINMTKRPSEAWLRGLRDKLTAGAPLDAVWWLVICLTGGSINCPEFLLASKGKPPRELIDMALANNTGTQRLILEAVAAIS